MVGGWRLSQMGFLFGGAQLAIDTTLVTRADGLPSHRCAIEDGAALVQAHRKKTALLSRGQEPMGDVGRL